MPASTTQPSVLTPFAPHATGNVFYVSSVGAGRANDVLHGRDPMTPFETLSYALQQCSNNNGDVVVLMEGHTETISAAGGVTATVPGVRVIGFGAGENRPLLRLVGTTAASIAIAADDVTIENVVIDATQLDAIISALTVDAENFTLRASDLLLGDALGQAVLGVLTTTNANRMTLDGCTFVGSADAGPTAFVKIVGAPDGIVIRDSWLVGRASEALIWNDTANLATDLRIERCTLRALSGSAAIKLASAVTGVIRDVALSGTTLTGLYDPGACASVNVQGANESVADAQAVPLPEVGTSLAAGRSLVDELLGASLNAGRTNSLVVAVDFSSATWNTVARHAIAVVSGACRVRILPRCTASLTSAGAPTMQFGDAADTTAMILSTDPLSIDQNHFWLDITPKKSAMTLALLDRVVNNTTLGLEIFVASLTGGTMEFLVWWEPLTDGATVTAGTGATF